MSQPLKVLVVDDTITYRSILTTVLETIPGVETCGTASNGKLALSKLSQIPVDLVLLDIEMPEMDGLETLRCIRQQYPDVGVVMISGMNKASADITIKALEAGALEFIPKPENTNAQASANDLRQNLIPIFRLYSTRRYLETTKAQVAVNKQSSILAPANSGVSSRPQIQAVSLPPVVRPSSSLARVDVIAIAVSTGGPRALHELIPKLPADLGVPVLLVQHMPPVFTASLANNLDKISRLRVKEAMAGEAVLPNTVYIAQGGKHMTVQRRKIAPGIVEIDMNEDAPEHSCRPAADVLFRSIAKTYGKNILAVVLTGMGYDGSLGIKALKEAGGCYCITQSAESCVVYGMPKAIDDMGLSDRSLSLENIPACITSLVLRKNQ